MVSEADFAVNVADFVSDRKGKPRWAVVAQFVDVGGAEPRCIDYRVRVIPDMGSVSACRWAGAKIVKELETDLSQAGRPWQYVASEKSGPPEGIPRFVFEQGSQSRLLAKARKISTQLEPRAQRLLDRQTRPRVGRPPVRTLGEKLRILADVEQAFASGSTLDEVARRHNMSRSAVRDLVSWARRDAQPRLFTSYGPGRTGGELTAAGRQLLDSKGN